MFQLKSQAKRPQPASMRAIFKAHAVVDEENSPENNIIISSNLKNDKKSDLAVNIDNAVSVE